MEDWGAVVDVGGVIVSGEEIRVVRGGVERYRWR